MLNKIISIPLSILEKKSFPTIEAIRKMSLEDIHTTYSENVKQWFTQKFQKNVVAISDIRTAYTEIEANVISYIEDTNKHFIRDIKEWANMDNIENELLDTYHEKYIKFQAIRNVLHSRLPRFRRGYSGYLKNINNMEVIYKWSTSRSIPNSMRQTIYTTDSFIEAASDLAHGVILSKDMRVVPPQCPFAIQNEKGEFINLYPKFRLGLEAVSIRNAMLGISNILKSLHEKALSHRSVEQDHFCVNEDGMVMSINGRGIGSAISHLIPIEKQSGNYIVPEFWPRVILEWILIRVITKPDSIDRFLAEIGNKKIGGSNGISLWTQLCDVSGWSKEDDPKNVLAKALCTILVGDLLDTDSDALSNRRVLKALEGTALGIPIKEALDLNLSESLQDDSGLVALYKSFDSDRSKTYMVSEAGDIYNLGITMREIIQKKTEGTLGLTKKGCMHTLKNLHETNSETLLVLITDFFGAYNDVRGSIRCKNTSSKKSRGIFSSSKKKTEYDHQHEYKNDPQLETIVEECLSLNPQKRPSAAKIIEILNGVGI